MKLKTISRLAILLFCILLVLTTFAGPNEELTVNEKSTKKSVSVELINNGANLKVKMGSTHLTLASNPLLEQEDLPTGIDLTEAQKEFNAEFLALTEEERLQFNENRLTFLKLSADILNMTKYGVSCLNCAVDITMNTAGWLKDLAGQAKDYSKSKWNQAWQAFKKPIPVTEQEAYEASLLRLENMKDTYGSTYFSEPLENLETATKTDLIKQAMVALNKIFYQNAKLASQSVEFGITIGIGISGNVGAKHDTDTEWAFGGLADLLLHVSYRPQTQTYILTLQSLTEVVHRPLTRITALLGFDGRVGVNFKNDQQAAVIKGESAYYPLGVGKSIYLDRIITWIGTELGTPANDLMGFASKGIIVNLLSVEGNDLNPLLLSLGKGSIAAKIFYFFKNARSSMTAGNSCESLDFY
jgi:hypothetical protein